MKTAPNPGRPGNFPSSEATAIKHLNQMLATHGIPEVITSDNVPFGSEELML